MSIKTWLEERRLNRRIKDFSEEERLEMLERSPLEAGAFQGEGFHIFMKSEPDFEKGYVTSLGEVTRDRAEDWIIRQFLINEKPENA